MTGKRTVVPFERSAAYWRSRARRHDTPEKKPAAAKLLRKALEKTGDPATALELARVYLDMACFTAAERCLTRAAARGGLTGEVCFFAGCCALNRGDEALAEDAFDLCQRIDPDAEWADRAQDILESMPPLGARPRGQARSDTMCRRAREALLSGDRERAALYAKRAWEMKKTVQGAVLMGAVREDGEAIPFFRRAAARAPGALQPRLLLAVSAYRAGKAAASRRALGEAGRLCRSITDFEEYCAAAWETGRAAEALKRVEEQLAETPASADFLRLKYLCLMRMGREDQARRTLEALLDIDPDDAAGLWYRRHPEDTRFYEGQKVFLAALGFQIRAVPERLRFGRLNRLLHGLTMALRDEVSAEAVYRLALPLWRRLPEAEKRRCDQNGRHIPLCLALSVLIRAGRREKAAELYRLSPNKRRIRRTLRRFEQWMTEG